MKKRILACLTMILLVLLCACGQAAQPEAAVCGHEAYSDILARLDAGDFDGARRLIDAMEGRKETGETESPEIPQTVPEAAVIADVEIVELTRENVREYFEFTEEFQIGEPSFCTQYIRLKEPYRQRLLSVENAQVEVSLLRCEAHGSIDPEEEEFRPEYYDPISREKEVRILELENSGSGWITGMTVFSDRGFFPDYAMDVDILSGSGKLVFAAE